MTIQEALHQALRLQESKKYQEAQSLYEQILAQIPNHPDALNLLGVLHYELANYPRAIDLIRHALAAKPDFLEAKINLGAALQATGQLEPAIAAYTEALKLSPNFAPLHNNLANALQSAGRLDQAIASYRRAIELDPNIPHAHHLLAITLKNTGDFNAAVQSYKKAIALKPDYPEAWSNLGVALLGLRQLDESIAAHRTAIKLNPASSGAHNNLGVALQETEQLDEAIAAFRKAVELNPGDPEALCNLGMALANNGQIDQAILIYRKALALKPDYTDAQLNLHSATVTKQKLEKAITAYSHDMAAIPNLADPHYTLGNIVADSRGPNLILGAAWNLRPADVYIFVESLRRHYQGDVMLLVTSQNAQPLLSYFHSRAITPIFFDAPIWMNIHIQIARYVRFAEILRSVGKQYDRILLTDVTDVLFQADPFDSLSEGELLCFLEAAGKTIADCATNSRWIRQIYGYSELEKIRHHEISCSGATIGSHRAVLNYIDLLLQHANPALFAKIKTVQFGHDQGIHNYLLRTGALPAAKLVPNAQHVYTLGFVPESEIILGPNGTLLAPGNRLCPIVHQYNYLPTAHAHVKSAYPTPDK